MSAAATSTIAVARSQKELRNHVAAWRRDNQTIALVPTMGALHKGHLSLVEIAKAKANKVIVSIFVNPTQFAPHEDFDSYPRMEADDLAKLDEAGVSLAYVPTDKELYPNGFTTTVSVSGLTEGLCATTRPHFFDGVTTVVSKLLIHCTPDVAVFGEKDFQQLLVIKRMTEDLGLPVNIVGAPIVREADGLAISSRNQYLSSSERNVAALFNKILKQAAEDIAAGNAIAAIIGQAKKALLDGGFDQVDYIDVRDAQDLAPVATLSRPARILGAVWLGKTRLIDNRAVLPR